MRAASLFLVGIAVAFISIAPANTEKAEDTKNIKKPIVHQKREKPRIEKRSGTGANLLQQEYALPPGEGGCHLEPQSGGI